jgi:hypothetical protein
MRKAGELVATAAVCHWNFIAISLTNRCFAPASVAIQPGGSSFSINRMEFPENES